MHSHGPSCLRGPVAHRRRLGKKDAGRDGRAAPAVRKDLVERVRREIAGGKYDTPEKLAEALRRLLEGLERP